MNYEQQALVGATGMDLIVALYDGIIRFLYQARACADCGDIYGRRLAVKKVVDILIYLQARLRPDVGGDAAASLSDFYAAMFTLTLEASHAHSVESFDEVLACIANVRDAWVIVARDPEAGRVLPRELRTREEKFRASTPPVHDASQSASRWSA